MYQAKIPIITAEIERRIRRGIYSEKLPPVTSLQLEFNTAKQTITEAVKILSQQGIVKSENKRDGVRIHRENLRGGSILIISRADSHSLLSKLSKEIKADGLSPVALTNSKVPVLPADTRGVLFVHSTLTVEWAEQLIRNGIPLVSCNQLFLSPKVDMFDFDLEHDINWLVQSLIEAGYHRIALFYSGYLEGFNDFFWRIFRKIKRRYGLPCESYDDIPVQWDMPVYNKLKYTFSQMQRGKKFPEVMISFYDVRNFLSEAIAESEIKLPENFQFVMLRARSKPVKKQIPGISTFFMKSSISPLWIASYNRLRELMFSTRPQPPKIQLFCRELCFDGELPVK